MSNPENQEDKLPDAFMSPPPDVSAVQEYYPKSMGDIDSALLQLVNLNNDNILHEPTCMICSSVDRKEIEVKWAETKKYEDIKKLFKGKSNQSLSNDIIDNHMKNHFDKGLKELQKIEYANRIRRLNSVELTTLDRIRLGLSTIEERLMGVNSISPDNNLSMAEVEKIKSTETARLIMAKTQLLKLQSGIMGEMKNKGDLIMIPRQDFIETFNKAIVESKTDEERRTIKQLLNSLAELSKKTQ